MGNEEETHHTLDLRAIVWPFCVSHLLGFFVEP